MKIRPVRVEFFHADRQTENFILGCLNNPCSINSSDLKMGNTLYMNTRISCCSHLELNSP